MIEPLWEIDRGLVITKGRNEMIQVARDGRDQYLEASLVLFTIIMLAKCLIS